MPAAELSVVICAYTLDRWTQLVEAVESVRVRPEVNEVVVVIDHEDRLLALARGRWPGITILPNVSQRGLSGARNTGVEAAAGRIVAFLDDDAVAEPQWAQRLLAAFELPDVVGVGGGATPVWPDGRGEELYAPELYWVVGCSHRGLPTTVTEVRNVIGCSMAFLRHSLVENGGFALDAGRIGTVPLGGEETDLCIRIRRADPRARIILDPHAMVRHHVSPDRVTRRYQRRRGWYEGVSKAILGRRLGAGDALSTERSYLVRVLPAAAGRELRRLGRGGGARLVGLGLVTGATVAGYLVTRVRLLGRPLSDGAPTAGAPLRAREATS